MREALHRQSGADSPFRWIAARALSESRDECDGGILGRGRFTPQPHDETCESYEIVGLRKCPAPIRLRHPDGLFTIFGHEGGLVFDHCRTMISSEHSTLS